MAESTNLTKVDYETNVLLLRYENLEFVDDVSNYQCRRCKKVVVKHYISNCGHRFCLNCKKYLLDGGLKYRWKCPVCKRVITHIRNDDVKLGHQINALRVRCPNSIFGCHFITSIINMPTHLTKCIVKKNVALPVISQETTSIEAVLDEIGKINKKIETLNEGMNVIGQMNIKIDKISESINVMTDMIIQLDKVDNQNKKDVEMAVDDLKRNFQGIQSELHDTTHKMQNDIKTIQKENTSQMEDEMKILQTQKSLKTTKTEDSDKTKFILELLNQKEEEFNQKLSQVKTEMENAMATEKALRIDECKEQNAKLNLIGGRLDKISEQMMTCAETHNSIDNQLKANIIKLEAELAQTKIKQEVQLATINHCNELISKLKLNEDEIISKIKQSQVKIYELEKKWERMEDYTSFKKISLHEAQEIVSNQEFLESQSLVYSWTLKGIKENMKKKRFECESDMFPLKGYDFEAKIKFNMYETGYVKMSLCFVNYPNTNRKIQFKVRPEVTYIIRDQVNNREGIITTIDMDYSESFEYGKYCNRSMCSTTIMHSPYVINDTMVIDIYVEPPSIAQQMHPTNGVVTYYINNYNMNKSFEKKGIVYSQASPYFYTSPNGYRVKAWIYLNGADDFKGKGLTAYIKFFSDEFNSTLPKTIKHKITIIIFNQSGTNKHLIKSAKQGSNMTDYNIDIAHHSEIENDGFLLNDTLIYRVEVEQI